MPFRFSYLFRVHCVCKTQHTKGEPFISCHFIFEVLIRGPKNANTFGNSPQSHNEQISINLSILPVSRVRKFFSKSSFLPHPHCIPQTTSRVEEQHFTKSTFALPFCMCVLRVYTFKFMQPTLNSPAAILLGRGVKNQELN